MDVEEQDALARKIALHVVLLIEERKNPQGDKVFLDKNMNTEVSRALCSWISKKRVHDQSLFFLGSPVIRGDEVLFSTPAAVHAAQEALDRIVPKAMVAGILSAAGMGFMKKGTTLAGKACRPWIATPATVAALNKPLDTPQTPT